jgi:GTP-binding protein HflX
LSNRTHSRFDRRTSAVLVTYKDPDSIEEADSLAAAAGYTVVEHITLREFPGGKYGIGQGKADILRTLVQSSRVGQIIVDDKLGASENYNLSKYCGCPVVDREKLVLEIFAKRAMTQEAKLQVKLAELSYELPRVREYVRYQTAGEQPGMFGYGSYEVEKYYRSIKARMDATRRKLLKAEARRELFRTHRKELNFPMISLAGYTSAGKTTLFNRMTQSLQPTSPKLFTTLSTTTRRVKFGDLDALLSDTVGFITRLPHYMIEAFKSTLEELTYADLVLLMIDVSDPPECLANKYETCVRTLAELNVQEGRILFVFNKTDKVGAVEAQRRISYVDSRAHSPIFISAKDGFGLDELRRRITSYLSGAAPKIEKKENPIPPGVSS